MTAARPGPNLWGMSDGDTSPADASDPAGSGRAHGAEEPRPPFPTAMERVWAHNFDKLRRWALAHPDPSLAPPKPDEPPAPDTDGPDPEPARQARARATPAPADQPGRVLRWLPASLQRLYRRLAEAIPYARSTRPRKLPSDDEAPRCSGQTRHYRLEIAYDAFCEHRPPPKQLFRHNPARRDLTSWCDKPNAWTGRRKPRCHHCETARAHYVAARDNADWKAEVARSSSSPAGVPCACSPSGGNTASSAGSSGRVTARRSPATAPTRCRCISSTSCGR